MITSEEVAVAQDAYMEGLKGFAGLEFVTTLEKYALLNFDTAFGRYGDGEHGLVSVHDTHPYRGTIGYDGGGLGVGLGYYTYDDSYIFSDGWSGLQNGNGRDAGEWEDFSWFRRRREGCPSDYHYRGGVLEQLALTSFLYPPRP
jgi:hypothetical protein